MKIGVADLAAVDIRDLITRHQQEMHDNSPPGTSFALDLSGLERPEVTVLSLREEGELLAVGAMRELDAQSGEVKAMRTADKALRRGAGQALLSHIEQLARERGYAKLMLETGTGDFFEPANRLYIRNGFTRRGPFGGYADSEFNLFYEKVL